MAANECIPLFRGGQPDLTGHTTAAVTGGTFLTYSATAQSDPGALSGNANGGNFQVATAAAGAKSCGVAAYDAAINTKVPYLRAGNIVPMIADGVIAFNADIEVGTAGKPKTATSGVIVGEATTAAASGAVVYVELKV